MPRPAPRDPGGEADGPGELAFFLSEATPYDVDIETHAVMSLEQMGEIAQRMMAEGGPG